MCLPLLLYMLTHLTGTAGECKIACGLSFSETTGLKTSYYASAARSMRARRKNYTIEGREAVSIGW